MAVSKNTLIIQIEEVSVNKVPFVRSDISFLSDNKNDFQLSINRLMPFYMTSKLIRSADCPLGLRCYMGVHDDLFDERTPLSCSKSAIKGNKTICFCKPTTFTGFTDADLGEQERKAIKAFGGELGLQTVLNQLTPINQRGC